MGKAKGNQKALRTPRGGGVTGILPLESGYWEASDGYGYVGTYKTFTAACDARAKARDDGYHPNHGRDWDVRAL